MVKPIATRYIKVIKMLGVSNTISCDTVVIQVKGRIHFIKRQYQSCIIDEFRYYEKLNNVKIMIDELYLSRIIDDTVRD